MQELIEAGVEPLAVCAPRMRKSHHSGKHDYQEYAQSYCEQLPRARFLGHLTEGSPATVPSSPRRLGSDAHPPTASMKLQTSASDAATWFESTSLADVAEHVVELRALWSTDFQIVAARTPGRRSGRLITHSRQAHPAALGLALAHPRGGFWTSPCSDCRSAVGARRDSVLKSRRPPAFAANLNVAFA